MTKPHDLRPCSKVVAAERARVLLGSYRKGDAADPEVYARSVVAVLMQYPEGVVTRVTDPRGGLPGTSTFLPSVAEVRAACEAEMHPIYEALRQRKIRNENEKLLGPAPLLTAVERDRRRVFIAGWRRDVMARLGHRETDARKMPEDSAERMALMAEIRADLDRKRAEWAATDARRAPAEEDPFD